MARVVRIRRSQGVVAQGCDVYIGRACSRGGWELPQSKWHNPYSVKAAGSAEQACILYEQYIRNSQLMDQLGELEGKVLGCWCKPGPCHGDVLLKLLEERAAIPSTVKWSIKLIPLHSQHTMEAAPTVHGPVSELPPTV